MTSSSANPSGLPGLKAIENVNDATIDARLADAGDAPVLLYFTATWCGPCRIFGPRLDAFVAANPEVIQVLRVDTDESPQWTDRLEIRAFPSLTLIVRGQQHWVMAGTVEDDELAQMLNSLSRAARQLVAGGETAGAATPALPTGPATTTVPQFDDPRVTVAHGTDQQEPGDRVTLAGDTGLSVRLTSDPRRIPACDTSVLGHFDSGAVTSVTLECSGLALAHLEDLSGLNRLSSVNVDSSAPIAAGVLDGFASLPALRSLRVFAPQLDPDRLRVALPAVRIDDGWTSPQLQALLPAPSPPAPAPALAAVRLASLPPGAALVLVEHPSDPVDKAVVSAVCGVTAAATGRVADAADPAMTRRYRLTAMSELLLIADGAVLARRDVCGPHHVEELLQVLLRAASTPVPAPPPALDGPGDSRQLAGVTGADAYLVPPRGSYIDYVAVAPGTPQQVPADWALMVRTGGDPVILDALPSQDVDMLQLMMPEAPTPRLIERLISWPRLADLTVYLGEWSEDVFRAVQDLSHLRRLVFIGQAPDERDFETQLRTALPWTIVNNDWTHPALM